MHDDLQIQIMQEEDMARQCRAGGFDFKCHLSCLGRYEHPERGGYDLRSPGSRFLALALEMAFRFGRLVSRKRPFSFGCDCRLVDLLVHNREDCNGRYAQVILEGGGSLRFLLPCITRGMLQSNVERIQRCVLTRHYGQHG